MLGEDFAKGVFKNMEFKNEVRRCYFCPFIRFGMA